MRSWRPRSLRGRLLAAYAVGMLLTAGLVVLLVASVADFHTDRLMRRALKEAARVVASRLALDTAGRPGEVSMPTDWQWVYDELPHDVEFRVVDAQGNSMAGSRREGELLPATLRIDPAQASASLRVEDRTVHVVTVPIEQTKGMYYLQAASSDRLATLASLPLRRPTRGNVLLTALVSIPVISALMLLTLGGLLRPLRDLSAAAARIEPRNLSARLSADSAPEELVPLIDAFNLALERLEQGYRTQQQFLAAAAHELKTPLALMRGQVELEGTADRSTLLADIDVMARQVQQLLNLAEVSEAGNYQFESIDVVDVAMQTVSFMSRMADRKLVHLDLKVPADELRWQGDKSALFTLLKNLLENAIQHSPAGGIVTVSLEVGGLTVHNEGAGIAADHMPLVFERFWRAHGQDDSQHRGVGLGLSICWEIALAHGWQLRVCDVPSGAMFRLDAPSVAESI